jgi:hypothetical protein
MSWCRVSIFRQENPHDSMTTTYPEPRAESILLEEHNPGPVNAHHHVVRGMCCEDVG